MASLNEIRNSFLEYFVQAGHENVPSAPLVPNNDPTLMFVNAGMVPFKNMFTGLEKRNYTTATSSQKCVRAGGKHNDLENVGYTARHHTFFEMLGNFSFGDYFKDRAIELAWTLITKEWQLPKDKLCVTVYADDQEAFDLWKKIAGLPDEKIIRIATSDNFWSMGDTGPCGPCSEIFFDHGDHIFGGPPGSPTEDGDRFVEIWNLVFMQYEQRLGGERVNLPRPSIDTGMGLERISAVMQGTHDNYRTDMMRALIETVAQLTGISPDGAQSASHRVMADHIRACSFLIADGVLPSNEGRGYVLRRIMRRSMRHAQLLGAKDPIMHRLFPTLKAQMGDAFPELIRAESLISETLRLEEERFRRTLSRGLELLDAETAHLTTGATLAGDVAFKLYDTFGFPLDLTQDALKVRKIDVDIEGFNMAMARQKAEARAAWSGSGDASTDELWYDVREQHGATEFLGYDRLKAQGEVRALIADGKLVDTLIAGQSGFMICNQTPFYGDSGGQLGDLGICVTANARATITDTHKKLGDVIVHSITIEHGTLSVNNAATLEVDENRRSNTAAHHSATHILHEALRQTLGDHVAQKGSMVGPERLRFDFAHPKSLSMEELETIETLSNHVIRQNAPVITRVMAIDDARNSGARALFGEKYGDEVRVVSMGQNPNASTTFSIELCGGTHVQRLGEIGLVTIIAEQAVSSGVRRIEALCGQAARTYFAQREATLRAMAALLKSPVEGALGRLASVLELNKKNEGEIAHMRRQLAMVGDSGAGVNSEVETINSVPFLAKIVAGVPLNEIKSLADEARKQIPSGVVVIAAASEDGKAGLVVSVSDDLTGRLNAVDLVRAGVPCVGGKGGGGRPDMAQAGGPDATKLHAAVESIKAAMQ